MMMDADASGNLTEEEVAAFLRTIAPRETASTGSSGLRDEEEEEEEDGAEWREASIKSTARQILREAGLDSNGRVTLEEFSLWRGREGVLGWIDAYHETVLHRLANGMGGQEGNSGFFGGAGGISGGWGELGLDRMLALFKAILAGPGEASPASAVLGAAVTNQSGSSGGGGKGSPPAAREPPRASPMGSLFPALAPIDGMSRNAWDSPLTQVLQGSYSTPAAAPPVELLSAQGTPTQKQTRNPQQQHGGGPEGGGFKPGFSPSPLDKFTMRDSPLDYFSPREDPFPASSDPIRPQGPRGTSPEAVRQGERTSIIEIRQPGRDTLDQHTVMGLGLTVHCNGDTLDQHTLPRSPTQTPTQQSPPPPQRGHPTPETVQKTPVVMASPGSPEAAPSEDGWLIPEWSQYDREKEGYEAGKRHARDAKAIMRTADKLKRNQRLTVVELEASTGLNPPFCDQPACLTLSPTPSLSNSPLFALPSSSV